MTVIKRENIMAHKQVAAVAKELAGCYYEELARVDVFYREAPDQRTWIAQAWPAFCDEARATLAKMLTTNIAESLKSDIADALIKDQALRASRLGIAQIRS